MLINSDKSASKSQVNASNNSKASSKRPSSNHYSSTSPISTATQPSSPNEKKLSK